MKQITYLGKHGIFMLFFMVLGIVSNVNAQGQYDVVTVIDVDEIIFECTVATVTLNVTNNYELDKLVDLSISLEIGNELLEFMDIGNFQQLPGVSFVSIDDVFIPAGGTVSESIQIMLKMTPASNLYPCYLNPEPISIQGRAETSNNAQELNLNTITVNVPKMCFIDGSSGITSTNWLSLLDNLGFSLEQLVIGGLVLEGDFLIDNDFEFSGPGNGRRFFIAKSGSKIRVNPSNSFITKNVDYTGCDGMWKGIRVAGTFSGDNFSIQDTERGLQMHNGSKMNLFNGEFINNYVGIYVPPKNNGLNNIEVEAFAELTFTSEGEFLPPYPGQSNVPVEVGFAGVQLNDVADIDLSGIQTPSSLFTVDYSNLANGIVAHNSNLTVSKSTFTKMTLEPTYEHSGRGISFTAESMYDAELVQTGLGNEMSSIVTFDNCEMGIYIDNAALVSSDNLMLEMGTGFNIRNCQDRKMTIQHNRLYASDFGVHSYNNFNSSGTIYDNEIFMDDPIDNNNSGIFLNETFLDQGWKVTNNFIYLDRSLNGIFARNNENAEIKSNTIFMDILDEYDIERYQGITLEGGANNVVSCNEINGNADVFEGFSNYKFSSGISLIGSSNATVACNDVDDTRFGIDVYGMCDGSTVQGNTFGNHYNSLLLGQYLNGGLVDGNAFLGPQYQKGNIWEFNNSQNGVQGDDIFGAVHLSDDYNVIEQSIFTVYGGNFPAFLPEVGLPQYNGNMPWFKDEFGLAYACSTSESPCPNGPGAELLLNEFDLQIMEGNIFTESFNDALTWTANRHLMKRLHALENETKLDPVFEDYLFKKEDANFSQFANIELLLKDQSLDQNLKKDNNSKPDRTRLEILNGFLEKVDYLQSKVNDLPEETIYESNQKVVNQILLERLANGSEALSNNQITVLEAIANQCPLSGGDAVFIARAMLDKTNYDNAEICNDIPEEVVILPNAPKLNKLVLSPNPTSGMINLKIENQPFQQGEILIYNVLGQIVYQEVVESDSYDIQLDLTNLPSNTYFGILTLDGQKIVLDPIVKK